MPTQRLHHVSSFIFRISIFGFPPTCRGVLCETNPIYHPNTQKMRNEPNCRTPSVPPPPISAKRTQLPYRWRLAGFSSPKNTKRTQFTTTPTQLRETNPILAPTPATHDPIMRNEPNFIPPHDQNPRNEPNSRVAFRISPRPNPNFYETNPIYPPPSFTPPPFPRNEPNLPHPTTQLRETNPILVPPPSSRPDRAPKYAKQTQFTDPRPKTAKRTQFPPRWTED